MYKHWITCPSTLYMLLLRAIILLQDTIMTDAQDGMRVKDHNRERFSREKCKEITKFTNARRVLFSG